MRDTEYRTRQRAAVLSWLRRHAGSHITAAELTEALCAEGTSIGRSTVYRTLDRLSADGIVRKFTTADGVGACYQYAGGDTEACLTHFHLKCLVCGSLFHIACDNLDTLTAHIVGQHHFTVDYAKTVLYGTCEPCRRALAVIKK